MFGHNELRRFKSSKVYGMVHPAHVLVVDDDRKLRMLLEQFLKENGYRVSCAANAAEARVFLANADIDIMILDVMMPGETGIVFLQSIRAQGIATPVLMLTARDTLDDRILGLDHGSDDYLTKPFEPTELIARIRAVLRRYQAAKDGKASTPIDAVLVLGKFTFTLSTGILQHTLTEEKIFLTSTELVLLRTLAQAPWQAFSRADLAQRMGHRVSERSVDVQVTRVRRKLEDDSKKPQYIQTIRHVGYAICPDAS